MLIYNQVITEGRTMRNLNLIPPKARQDARRSLAQSANFLRGNSTTRADAIEAWLRRIKNDRNWSRALMGLPLIAPVDPVILVWCERLGSPSANQPEISEAPDAMNP